MSNVHRVMLSAALLAMSAHAGATELLFSGTVERQIVQPSGTPDCASPCPANSAPDAHGSARVCVSNRGGCQVVEVRVLHDYLGTARAPMERFTSRTGEWGKLNFPDSNQPILVHAVDGVAHWTALTTRDGADAIDTADTAFMGQFVKQHAATFTPGGDRKLPVAQLVQRIR